MSFAKRRLVMSQTVSEEEYNHTTIQQMNYLRPLLKQQLLGNEMVALDYGCGAGRFTGMLNDFIPAVLGYDPDPEMIAAGPDTLRRLTSDIVAVSREGPYHLIFIFLVLGGVKRWLPGVALNITRLLAPNGLLFLCEHTDKKREGTWWQFRPMQFYTDLFAPYVPLRRIGECMQLENSVTIMAGRKR